MSRADRSSIDEFLRAFLLRALPAAPSAADMQIPFLEMGANSLVLMEVQRAVEARFGITIAIPQFFQELTHMEALADYIERNQAATLSVPVGAGLPALGSATSAGTGSTSRRGTRARAGPRRTGIRRRHASPALAAGDSRPRPL